MEKNILITNFEMKNYMGSEINAATIAKRFKELGYKVYMLSMCFDDPIFSDVKEYFDVIIDIKNNDFDFSNIIFDLVWAHHSFLLDWLIFENGIKAKKVIVSSLSGLVPFEYVPQYANDLSLVLANSEETKEHLIKEGIKEIVVFENYSFEKYFENNNKVCELKNIAIVSNHIPEELAQAKDKLEKLGYNVEIYGVEGKRELITDQILLNYDAIITIGKTVQYAMSLQIPVYIYDIHGGDGYITIENLEKNRNKNFSGRGFSKKNTEQICNEIINNFDEALKLTPVLKQYAYENFCFEKNIDLIIKILNEKEELDLDFIRKKYSPYRRKALISRQLSNYLIGKYEDILRIQRHNLYTEIKRLTINEEELRNAIIEKDELIKKQGEIITNQEKIITQIKESKLGKLKKKLKHGRE